MPRLLLLRHAKAAWPSGVLDIDRPLAARGREAAMLMARYMKAEGLIPERVIVSPSRRTLETWEIMKPVLQDVRFQEDQRIYEAPVSQLLKVVREADPPVKTLLVIGHNPGFEDLAGLLIDGGDPEGLQLLGQKYPTAGLAVIDFQESGWAQVAEKTGRLERFITPKSLGRGDDD